MLQMYNTIISADSITALCKEHETELENLIDRYCGNE